MLQWCSPKRRQRVQEFDFKIDRDMCIVSEVLVKFLGCRLLHLPVTAMTRFQIQKNHWGKPSLIYDRKRFNCSISHSAGMVLVGVAFTEIDVDVQSTHKFLSNSSRIFNLKEQRLNRLHPVNKLILWSMKEVASKFLGKGLLLNFHDLNFVPQTTDYELYRCYHHNFYVRLNRDFLPDNVVTLAFNQPKALSFVKNVNIFTISHLLKVLDLP